jgi:hypothetical protein
MPNRMLDKMVIFVDRVRCGEGQMCGEGTGGRGLCSARYKGGIMWGGGGNVCISFGAEFLCVRLLTWNINSK